MAIHMELVGPILLLLIRVAVSADMTDLPGIFSSTICDNNGLKKELLPLCKCKERISVTDIHSLCRSHRELSACIEQEIATTTNYSGYLAVVFNKTRMLNTMDYLCKLLNGGDLTPCSRIAEIDRFEQTFRTELEAMSAGTVTQEHACKITDDLSKNYWKSLESLCPVKIRHVVSKLAESYISTNCSMFLKESQSQKCAVIKKAFHPDTQGNVNECLAAVDTVVKCFARERLDSHHPYDRWTNIDLDMDKFTLYEQLRCDLEKDLDKKCTKKYYSELKQCGDIYNNGYTTQVEMIKNSKEVTVEDVCVVFHNVSECISRLLIECPVDRIHFHSLFCRSMPSSCHCPVDISSVRATLSSAIMAPSAIYYILALRVVISLF